MTIDDARAALRRGDVRVAYKRADGETEYGTITAVGRVWVFVQYGGLDHPIADKPEDLTLLAGKAAGDG
jgi:hypothetical protein